MELSRRKHLFNCALELPEDQRPTYLDSACQGDSALRAEVDALIAALSRAGEFLAGPTLEHGHALPSTDLPDGPAETIGPYKLLRPIGEGGFGTVYLAEQQRPVRRNVAIKLIKLGMDTKQVIARFEAERQALALMDHPNVARVFDAGATDAGRPYFVMELVEGVPLTEYCDVQRLPIPRRIELLIQVCHAVQHAHQKGIIHRDLKPSNVLIATHDGRPLAKVIDFGIAKATATPLTDQSPLTELRQWLGTPQYMSPEQAEGSADIDTRSDVYSLGVLLYELLAGSPPFDPDEIRGKGIADLQRIIREVEPPSPSTRLSTSSELPALARRRALEPRKLPAAVRGELDWIVMRCLEKDRTRRYDSASALAADLARHLADEPVSAAAPSRRYRLGKFLCRNKGPVAAAAAIFTVLTAGIVGTTIGLLGQTHQRHIADTQRGIAEQRTALANQREREARNQAAIAEGVSAFQRDMFTLAEPDHFGESVTVLQLMLAGARELERGVLSDGPLIQAGVRQAIGGTLLRLGRLDLAETNLLNSLELFQRQLGNDHRQTAGTLSLLGELRFAQDRLPEAEDLHKQALSIRRAVTPPDDAGVLVSLRWLSAVARRQGHPADAEQLALEALELAPRIPRLPPRELAACLNELALTLIDQGKLPEAEARLRDSVETCRATYREGHPQTATVLHNLGDLLLKMGELPKSHEVHVEAMAIRRKALPADHPGIAHSLSKVATSLWNQGDLPGAASTYQQALEINRNALPAHHVAIVGNLSNLSIVLRLQGKPDKALPLIQEALELQRKTQRHDHPYIGMNLANLAMTLTDVGQLESAEQAARQAVQVFQGRADLTLADAQSVLAHVLWQRRQLDEAESLFRGVLEIRNKLLTGAHPSLAEALLNLAEVQRDRGKLEAAEEFYRRSLALAERLPPRHPILPRLYTGLGLTLVARKSPTEAEPFLSKAIEANARMLGDDDLEVGFSRYELARNLVLLGRRGEAEAQFLQAARILEAAPHTAPQWRQRIVEALSEFYSEWDRIEPGNGYGEKAATWQARRPATRPATAPPGPAAPASAQ